jgi:hypothetical protein
MRFAACGASRSRRVGHVLCRPRGVTVLPSRRWRRVRTVRPMCVPPAARRDRGGTSTRCAARATRPPSPAGAGGGCAPCGPRVCRRRRVAIAAGRARSVPPARRDCPPYRPFLFACCIHSVCLSTRIPRPSVSALQRRAAMLRVTSPHPCACSCPPTPQGSSSRACAFAHARRQSRVLYSLIPADRRQQPQPHCSFLLTAR